MGLKINLSTISLLGVGVPSEQVSHLANHIGCSHMVTWFPYLGSTVGGVMNHASAWKHMMGKIVARLSKWKVKTLLVGGRLTLLKLFLGSIPTFFMSLLKPL